MQSLLLFASIAMALVLSRRLGIGFSLLISSLFLGISTIGMSFELFLCYFQLQSLEIMALVFLTYTLANLMDRLGMLERLSNSLNESFGSISIFMIPLLIGLIPMPAGALVSASMLLPLAKNSKIGSERVTVINYWFRHVWTPVWPLYPSVIIALAVLEIQYESYLISTFPIALVSFFLGLFLLKGLEFDFKLKKLRSAVMNIYPIFVLLVLYFIFKNLLISIAISILLVAVQNRVKAEDFRSVLRRAFDIRILALVFAVMGYKNIIQLSNSAEILYKELSFMPMELAAFVVFFLVGFSTGIEMSYSSIALPVFHGFVERSENLLLAISAGFFGVMLSPFHLCYALTVEFFKADILKCYKLLISLAFPAILFCCVIYFMLSFY